MKFDVINYHSLDFNLMKGVNVMEKDDSSFEEIGLMQDKIKNKRIVHGVAFDMNSFSLDKVLKTIKDEHKKKKKDR